MTSNEICDAILYLVRFYGNENKGLTETEIISQVQNFSPHEIHVAIQQLLDDGRLVANDLSSPPRYNLQERIELADRHDLDQEAAKHSDLWLEDEVIRATNSRRILERIAEKSVVRTMAESYTSEEDIASFVISIASKIADENPIDLLLEMVKWVVYDINELAETLSIELARRPTEARKVAREIGFRSKKAERLFQRLFRLDDQVILTIPTIRNMQRHGAKVEFNRDLARKRLEERIYGEKFINIVEVPENSHSCAVGTDASIGDITISHARGSFIPPVPASLFIAGGAMRVRRQNGEATFSQYWDYDIDPREIEQYAELQAAEVGLLISPNLKGEVITDFQHLSVAAMELRQYFEEVRIINGQANWHPYGDVPELDIPPKVNLLFRDGRIFPLVHRIEDYEGASAPDDLLYGAIVRKEIDTFYTVFHNTVGRGRLGATYAGAVKAPAFSWLSMIVFWYLYKVTGDDAFRRMFYRPPLNDQAVSHLLFWGICDSNPYLIDPSRRYTLITFQTIRRFSDIAFLAHPIMYQQNDRNWFDVDENSEDSWSQYIEFHISEVEKSHRTHRRGLGSLGGVDEYSYFMELCRRAAVAMFYAAPCRIYEATIKHNAHALMPRWEIALDLSQDNFDKILGERMTDLLMWITDPDGLARDNEHAVGGFANVSTALPLMIPDVVLEAHKAVTVTRSEQTRLVEEMIYELIDLLRQSNSQRS